MSAPGRQADHDDGLDSFTPDHMSIWIELFYDLGFVAAILIISVAVAHVHPSSGIIWIVLVFAALWWVWFTTTVCANRFRIVDLPHWLLLLFQMVVIVLMAMEARVSVTGDSAYLALEYGLLLLTVGLMYFRAARLGKSSDSGYAVRLAVLNAVSAACFFVAVFLPESARLILSAAGLVLLVIPSIIILHRLNDFSNDDEKHFADRMGAFTLIVCGESFVEIAISVSGATIDTIDVVALVFEFILVFALFTSYFDDIPAAGLNQRRFGGWASLHLVTQICIAVNIRSSRGAVGRLRSSATECESRSHRFTEYLRIAGTAVAASKLINLDTSHRLPDIEILRLTTPLAILYIALAGVGVCTRRRPVGPLAVARVLTAVAVAVVGVAAWWIPWIHLAEALPIFAAIAVIHAFVAVRLRTRTLVIDATALNLL